MKKIYIKKGEDILKEGTQSDCAYIIESGSVQLSKSTPKGKRKILGTLHEMEIFGELGLIDGLPRTATVTALEDCTISILTPDIFNSLAKRNPQALMPILKVLATRLRGTLKMVEDLQSGAEPKAT